MSELRELYQQVILDHNKSPRNFRELENPSHEAEGYNPLCGDRLHVYLHLDDNEIIQEVSFVGSGCAISKASASMMSMALKGKTQEEAHELFKNFQQMVTSDISEEPKVNGLGKLVVFSGIREFPTRVKCAILPWHTFQAAIKGNQKTVTTE